MTVINTRMAARTSANPVTRWDHADLVQRVVDVLDLALRMVRSVAEPSSSRLAATPDLAVGLLREKVVSETALLLLCVEPRCGHDVRIRERFETLGALLAPLARHDDVMAAICLDPAQARDHAIGHIILSHLGYPDPRVDALLDSYIQAPWYKSPAEYRAFAEKYFVEVKPLLIKAGLAKA